MKKKIMLFIPAYNCENQILRVLAKINNEVQIYIDEIVIIDNCSSDNTLLKAEEGALSIATKVTLLKNNENYNLGGSIKSAFLYSIKHNYDYMITLHGDDQADIRDFLPFLKKGDYEKSDLLIGARFHHASTLQGYSKLRIIGNKTLNKVCSLINRRPVDDLIAGINCFKISFFKSMFFLNFPDNLTFDAHVLLYAFNKKASVSYVPITWREENQISNAKVMSQAIIILKLFFNYVIKGDKVFSKDSSAYSKAFHYPSEVIFQK